MFEKILAKLKQQRGNNTAVSDRTLEDMAKTYLPLVTSDEVLEKIDFSLALTSVFGNINHISAEAVKKAAIEWEQNQKKAADDAKKAADDAKKKKKTDEEVPEYIQVILDSNKLLLERTEQLNREIGALKNNQILDERSLKLKRTLEGLPDFVAKPITLAFQKTNFNSDDEFTQYLTEIEQQKASFIQTSKEKGLNDFLPPSEVKKPIETGETPVLGEALKILQDSTKPEK